MKRIIALILAIVSVAMLLTACGTKADGTYTATVSSNDYFAASAVKSNMEGGDKRPDGSDAMVPFSSLFGMIDTRIGEGTNIADYYTATLTLSGSTYKLVKKINVNMDYVADAVKDMMSTDIPMLELTFSGSFKADGNTVTLSVPTKVVANVTPVAGMADAYTRFGGTFVGESADSADAESYPGKFFYYFNTLYFVESTAISEMTVTIDSANKTFTA